jgi:hypothetical protein
MYIRGGLGMIGMCVVTQMDDITKVYLLIGEAALQCQQTVGRKG